MASQRTVNCKCVRPWGRAPQTPCPLTSGVFQVEAPEEASRTQAILMSRETVSGTKQETEGASCSSGHHGQLSVNDPMGESTSYRPAA